MSKAALRSRGTRTETELASEAICKSLTTLACAGSALVKTKFSLKGLYNCFEMSSELLGNF